MRTGKQVLGLGVAAWHFFFWMILRYTGMASPRHSHHSGFSGHLDVTEPSLSLRDAGFGGGGQRVPAGPMPLHHIARSPLYFMKVRGCHLSALC